jgi:hypothetical protein
MSSGHPTNSASGPTTWCDWPESNRHALQRQILSLLCIPVSPQSQIYWSEYEDLNLGPPAPKAGALPGCAILRHLLPRLN